MAVPGAATPVRIRVSNFNYERDYRGKENIAATVRNIFLDAFPEAYYITEWNAPDYILTGTIKELGLSSRGITSYGLGGYQNFSSEFVVEIELYTAEGKRILKETIRGNRARSDLGAAILGGPTGRDSERKILQELWSMDPEREEFRRSIMGEAIYRAAVRAVPEVSLAIFGEPYGLAGEVVLVRGSEVYLDIGRDYNLREGNVLTLYALDQEVIRSRDRKVLGNIPGREIGKLEITGIFDRELSKGIILDSVSAAQKGDIVIFK